jgi:hypothetical protein
MDDAAIVRGFQAVAELHRGDERLASGQGSPGEAIRQRVAVDQLHHDDRRAGGILDAEHLGDVGVVERCEHLRFALEAVAAIVVAQRGQRQDLQGDISSEPGIAGAKHFAHSAFAQLVEDFIGA